MKLIFTMNGKYQHFRDKGYNIPKYLLPWKTSTIINKIISLLATSAFTSDDIYLVVNIRDYDYFGHLDWIMDDLYIPERNLIVLNDTSGQAETAYEACLKIQDKNVPVFFHNCDTILHDRDFIAIADRMQGHHGYIDVFTSNNHEYSYVMIEPKTGLVKNIAEKVLISGYATSGLYGFKSVEYYISRFSGQIYIADVYRDIIEQGGKVITGPVYSEANTIVLGTPEQYIEQSKKLIYN